MYDYDWKEEYDLRERLIGRFGELLYGLMETVCILGVKSCVNSLITHFELETLGQFENF